MNRKIVITGGSGFIGRSLCDELVSNGYDVIILSRDPGRVKHLTNPNIRIAQWDLKRPDIWLQHASSALAVVNLAGDNIASSLRWNATKKNRILSSRLEAAQAVSDAIAQAEVKPRVLVQASAIGYYGDRFDEVLTECSAPGEGFLANIASKWEQTVDPIRQQGLRCVTVRTGIVLGPGGGFLGRIVLPFRLYLGGHPGKGRHWISWIHIADEVAAIRFLIERDDLSGPFNLTSPMPLQARDFFKELGRTLGRPSWLHVPGFMLQLMLGELARELLLSGQRVIPQRLMDSGFTFNYPDAGSALRDILV